MDTARLTALARQYMTETVTFTRVTGRGAAVGTVPVGTAAPAWRLGQQRATFIQAGADVIATYQFVVDTPESIVAQDVLVDASGAQYRVVSAVRTLPGLPLELVCVGVDV
jgi:hypothetical protein